MLAAMSGSPVLMLGLAARPCIRLDTWDTMIIPLPFARGAIVWEPPITLERADAAGGVEHLQREWAERLTAATERAEAMLR